MKVTSLNNDSDYNDDFEFSAKQNNEMREFVVPNNLAGSRLDAALAKLMPDFSRSRITSWIKEGEVLVNGAPCEPKAKLIGQENIQVTIIPSEENLAFIPEDIALNVVYEDETVIVINKAANLVVHPASGNWTGTVLNGLLYHYPELQQIPRAGIVHRLDKDTSGLMVIARTLPAQNHLVQQLQNRTVKRIYRAVCDGIVPFDGMIETRIGRDPHNRIKMAVVKFGGKEAITHVKVLERYLTHSYIECSLETGRTHQIRVHMREARHPLAGDATYGNPRLKCSDEVKEAVRSLKRQALHAYRLSFIHPVSGETVSFEAPIPDDMYHVLSVLRLEAGLDSSLSHEEAYQQLLPVDDEDDWDDEDDVEVIYVRD